MLSSCDEVGSFPTNPSYADVRLRVLGRRFSLRLHACLGNRSRPKEQRHFVAAAAAPAAAPLAGGGGCGPNQRARGEGGWIGRRGVCVGSCEACIRALLKAVFRAISDAKAGPDWAATYARAWDGKFWSDYVSAGMRMLVVGVFGCVHSLHRSIYIIHERTVGKSVLAPLSVGLVCMVRIEQKPYAERLFLLLTLAVAQHGARNRRAIGGRGLLRTQINPLVEARIFRVVRSSYLQPFACLVVHRTLATYRNNFSTCLPVSTPDSRRNIYWSRLRQVLCGAGESLDSSATKSHTCGTVTL